MNLELINITKERRRIIFILAGLIVGIPLANLCRPFRPFAFWEENISEEPFFIFRFIVSFVGILLTLYSFVLLCKSLSRPSTNTIKMRAFEILLFILVFEIGWKHYPYWANGLSYIGCGGGTYDPKGLVPMAYIGEFWRIPIMLFYPIELILIPTTFVILIVTSIKSKKIDLITLLGIVIIATTIALNYFINTDYWAWLMD